MKCFFFSTRMPLNLVAKIAATLSLLPAIGAYAGNLYVPGYSFESPSVQYVAPYIDSWQVSPQPAGYDTNIFGDYGNLTGVFANTPNTPDFITNADGVQLAYLFAYPGLALFQDYNSTDYANPAPNHAFNSLYQPGKTYTLTVGLTSSSEEPLTQGSTLLVSLYYRDASNNMVTIASTNVTYDTNVFTNLDQLLDFSVTTPEVQTNDAWAYHNIGIQMGSTVAPQSIGGVWDLDNVRLKENIFIENFSFESPAVQYLAPEVDDWQTSTQPSDFNAGLFGDYANLTGVFANTPDTSDYIINADGSQLAYLFAYPQLALFQDNNSTGYMGAPATHALNATFKPGKSYDLAIGLTTSTEEPLTSGSTLLVNLYYRDASNNMVTVAATTATYSTNVFTNIDQLLDFHAIIPVVKATDPWAGKQMGVEFESTVAPQYIGGVWDLDNARITETTATLLSVPALTSGSVTLSLASEPNLHFELLATTNLSQPLSNWVSVVTFTNTTGTYSFTDTNTTLSQRFYRAHQLP